MTEIRSPKYTHGGSVLLMTAELWRILNKLV